VGTILNYTEETKRPRQVYYTENRQEQTSAGNRSSTVDKEVAFRIPERSKGKGKGTGGGSSWGWQVEKRI